MNISRNSLPYRFIQFVLGTRHYNMPKSLCGFFWKFIAAIVVGGVKLIGISVGAIIAFAAFILAPVYTLYGLLNGEGVIENGELGLAVLIMYTVFILMTITSLAVESFKEKYRERLYNKLHHPKAQTKSEPNILIEYIKAKKSKVCPMIEYVE